MPPPDQHLVEFVMPLDQLLRAGIYRLLLCVGMTESSVTNLVGLS